MVDIQVIRNGEFRQDRRLCNKLREIIAPSYEDPTAILDREVNHCDTLYLALDSEKQIVSLFLTADETVRVSDRDLDSVYLGLSATRQDKKGIGHVAHLYARCIRDCVAWEHASSRRVLLWGTTATPTAFVGASRFLANVEPTLAGSYTNFGEHVARSLRCANAWARSGRGEHPFVLKGIAESTLYSDTELRRIRRLTRRFRLFDQLGIDERVGDRLLFWGRLPCLSNTIPRRLRSARGIAK